MMTPMHAVELAELRSKVTSLKSELEVKELEV